MNDRRSVSSQSQSCSQKPLFCFSESVSTMKRNGCLLLPLGARVAAKKISRSTSSGMGSFLYLRIARVVAMPSSNPTVSVANGCCSVMASDDPSPEHQHLLPTSNAYDHGLRLLPELPQLFRRPMEHQATSLRVVHRLVHLTIAMSLATTSCNDFP
ncbi:MAG: hypothetical protein RI898_1500 [Actinomycetota bacterium]